MGQLDPEDQDSDDDDLEIGLMGETPKHFAVQVVDMLALHLPPEKLCPHVVSETLLLLLALGRYSPLKPRLSG